jgi:uncharacterized protein (TIGR02145 family)
MRISATIMLFLGTTLWICSCEKAEEELKAPLTSVTDYDGNIYYTTKIGDQWWMTSNLKTTHYADGAEIPLVESISEWEALGSKRPAYCYYDNNPHEAAFTYGALYTWAAAMNGSGSSNAYPSDVQGVCPDGWHVPSDSEWKALEMHLGMMTAEVDTTGPRGRYIGSQLAINSELWANGLLKENTSFGASDFFALPGGGRRYNGTFGHQGDNANFWTATERDSARAWGRHLYSLYTTVHRYSNVKSDGFSVRCVKDD